MIARSWDRGRVLVNASGHRRLGLLDQQEVPFVRAVIREAVALRSELDNLLRGSTIHRWDAVGGIPRCGSGKPCRSQDSQPRSDRSATLSMTP